MKELIEKYYNEQLSHVDDVKKRSCLLGEYTLWLLEDDNFDCRDDSDEVSIAMIRWWMDRKLLDKK